MPLSKHPEPLGQLLSGIKIVMVGTTHPGNIGAAARVMANMGLSGLRLVSPRVFPHEDATARAAGADHVLQNAEVFRDLTTAVRDCVFVIGATARRRSISFTPFDSASAAHKLSQSLVTGPVALVFGPEASGLSNEHLDLCHGHLRIDVDEQFQSLNVATAVSIMVYECRKACLALHEGPAIETETELKPNTMGEFDGLMQHLETVMDQTGFTNGPRVKLARKIRRVLLQGVSTAEEVNILRGFLTSVQHLGQSNSPEE